MGNSQQNASDIMTCSVDQRLVVRIPINNDMDKVKSVFQLLTNHRISRSEEHFIISTETIDHADMKEYTSLLLQQYKDADDETQEYLSRLHINKEGTQVAKAIVIGTKNEFSISLIASNRRTTTEKDEHQVLIASMKRKIDMSATWNLFAKIFGIKSEQQKELESIVLKLNDEDNKKCVEAMVFYILGEKIRQFFGNSIDVEFVQN